MAEGIRDKVAVAGIGCTKFGEHWDKDGKDLLVDAVDEALEDAGVTLDDIEASWAGFLYPSTGTSGTTLADALKFYGKPSTRVENFCASGMEAFRNACYGVASGAYDIVLAAGAEKILDVGGSGLPSTGDDHAVLPYASAPGLFAMAATRSMDEYGWDKEDLANVAVKNHENGAVHPKAHFQRETTVEKVVSAPTIAAPLGRYDCCPVSDGGAALVLTTPEIARNLNHADDFARVKALGIAVTSRQPFYKPDFEFTYFPATREASRLAYEEAGVNNPLEEISFCEIHDCFTITELLTTQDLGFCETGEAADFVGAGETRVEGSIPINPSGGLKSFGHPIGATGCRMIYEVVKQLQERADGRQVEDPSLGLAHNLGGPGAIGAVSILGLN